MPECIDKALFNQTGGREAVEWFQHIFEVRKIRGQEHKVFLNIAYAIGNTYNNMGRPDEAYQCHQYDSGETKG